MKSSRHNGIASALGAALLFGASTPLAKLVVSSTSPVLVAGLLYLGSGVGLAVLRMIHAATGVRQAEIPLARKDLPWLAGAIFAGGVAGPAFLMLGLLKTPASAASLLLNLEARFALWRRPLDQLSVRSKPEGHPGLESFPVRGRGARPAADHRHDGFCRSG